MRKFLLLLGCFAASPLTAGETTLSGEAIKTTLSGSLLALDTPIGTTVSVRINHDGLMSGEAGALGAVLGSAKDRGRWWVESNRVCFKWFRWFDAEPRCVTISLDGKRFTWQREDGDTGTGTIIEQGKSIEKPRAIVAEAVKPVGPKSPAKKVEIAAATPRLESRSETIAPKSGAQHTAKELAGAAPKTTVEPAQPATTTVAFRVPHPHLAVRPKHQAKIAVASVKPQFFASAKVAPAKVAPAKVAPAKVASAKVEKLDRKPFRVAGVEPSDVLNIRNGPSQDYESVGGIPPDTRGITITGPCLNDWCPVKHRTLIGWVNRRYLAEETASETSAANIPNYWDASP
ncbi:MAG: SH3 domain-containing protein [Proteobacteria bacterium]|nr:SH3 domain-containing protein [Pseudomonadota bacterium]